MCLARCCAYEVDPLGNVAVLCWKFRALSSIYVELPDVKCALCVMLRLSVVYLQQPLKTSIAIVVPNSNRKAHTWFSTAMATTNPTVQGELAQDPQVATGSGDKGLDTVDKSKELGRLACNIIPHILNLYNCTATALDYEVYAPNATFEDPLMRAEGVKQIKSAFYSIPKVFKEARVVRYEVEEVETSPGTGEIKIDNLQQYVVAGQQIDMNSLIKLQVENGKVIRHEDWWNGKELWNKDTVKWPLVGRAASLWRRGNMIVTHALMGFGKDPRPKS